MKSERNPPTTVLVLSGFYSNLISQVICLRSGPKPIFKGSEPTKKIKNPDEPWLELRSFLFINY